MKKQPKIKEYTAKVKWSAIFVLMIFLTPMLITSYSYRILSWVIDRMDSVAVALGRANDYLHLKSEELFQYLIS